MEHNQQFNGYKLVPARPPEKALEQARMAYRNASVYDVTDVWWRIWHDYDHVEPPLITVRADVTPKVAVDIQWALVDELVKANLDKAMLLQIVGTAKDDTPEVECPAELIERVNKNPDALSILYDVNLLPEQVQTSQDIQRMFTIVALVEGIQHLKRNANVG